MKSQVTKEGSNSAPIKSESSVLIWSVVGELRESSLSKRERWRRLTWCFTISEHDQAIFATGARVSAGGRRSEWEKRTP